jgi:hypothetical protein
LRRLRVEATAVIDGAPEDVYALLADYRDGRPRVLPPVNFRDVEVEEGGRGAGTILRFRSVAGRGQRHYRMLVSEPEPGRVLVESSMNSSLVTTLTVEPTSDAQHSRVQIATEIDAYGGLLGLAQRVMCSRAMRQIYKKELRLLAALMARGATDGGRRTMGIS